jgi:hypothetical protein
MSLWVERILREFPTEILRLWIAVDPDDVLLDERVLAGLRGKGFAVVPFEDSVVFRAEYEERYRSDWDNKEGATGKALVLHLRETKANELPWDYLKQAREVSLGLADLFPKLSYAVVRQLDAEYLEPLFDAQHRHAPQPLAEAATKEFVLTHIFRLSPHLISGPEELWPTLLRLHRREHVLPQVLADHMAHVLGSSAAFHDMPISELLCAKSSFLRVVQAAWYRYLAEHGVTGRRIAESFHPSYLDRVNIPFGQQDVRDIIDSMFLDGTLHPLEVQTSSGNLPEWAHVGVVHDPSAMRNLVLEGAKSLLQALPTAEAPYRDWTHFSRRLGEVIARFHGLDAARAEDVQGSVLELQRAADARLLEWARKHYADLPSLPAAKGPVMVHHVPRYLAMRREAGEDKIALLVFDGLAVDQWIQIRESAARQLRTVGFEENACFAWLPTLTSVSRQALFSGLKPREFPETIETTAQEPALWSRFWQDQGLRAQEVLYRKGIKRNDQLGDLEAAIANPSIKIAGLVIDTVDEIVHGAVLGKRGIASQVATWCESGFVDRLFKLLLDHGFHVYLTADHGNVEAVGQGRPNQGLTPELRGERVRTYRSETLAEESAAANPNTCRMDIAGLPANFIPLFAGERTAFVPKGEQVVVHGGVSVEELIVPFVKVSYLN